MEQPNMVISQKTFDNFINSSIALYKQIKIKSDNVKAVTVEESDFYNAFTAYAKELTEHINNELDKN